MLEPPDIPTERIAACLRDEFGVPTLEVTFLPLGADRNAAVFRARAHDGRHYFVKLKRGSIDEVALAVPRFLSEQGIVQIVPPLAARSGQLWATLGEYATILYPFIEARRGFDVPMTERLWGELGRTLRRIHTIPVPPELAARLARETWSTRGRELVKSYLETARTQRFAEPVAAQLAAFLTLKRDEIIDLVARAERLGLALRERPPELVLCHSDVHAGNVLIDAGDRLYIVDWDEPILAPKERDLMFAGGAQGFAGHSPEDEERFCWQGYRPCLIDFRALAYYRYERIIQDIATYGDQIWSSDQGGSDREVWLQHLMNNFLPGNTIEIAYRRDRTAQ